MNRPASTSSCSKNSSAAYIPLKRPNVKPRVELVQRQHRLLLRADLSGNRSLQPGLAKVVEIMAPLRPVQEYWVMPPGQLEGEIRREAANLGGFHLRFALLPELGVGINQVDVN